MSLDKGYAATAAITLATGAALATAYVSQYVFGLLPCTLCYIQRAPYALALGLGLLSLMPAVDARSRRIILYHLLLLFLIDAGVAFFHAGVEYHWWEGPSTCTGGAAKFSLDDLSSALSKPVHPSCDEPAFVFMGLSMAGYNTIAALALAGFSLFAAGHKRWWTHA